MANPTTTTARAPLTGDDLIDVATSGYKWNLGADRVIDWSLSNGLDGETLPNREALTAAVAQALAAISVYADVKFNYVGFFADPTAASAMGSEINVTVIRDRDFLADSVLGAGYYPRTVYGFAAGDVLINLNSVAGQFSTFAPGSSGFQLLLHELGHALGLKHPFDDDGVGRTVIDDTNFYGRDIDWFTVMSYADSYSSNRLQYEASTPMLMDVLALQYLYGVNPLTGAGDNLYSLAVNDTYATIWDAGGADMVSAAGSEVGWEIVLPWETASSLSPRKTGYAMPMTDLRLASPHTLDWLVGDLENAVGSSSADALYGNSLGNRLQGDGGNDSIDGYEGRDTAVYGAASTNFTWTRTSAGTWTVRDIRPGSPEGTDSLYRIESLSFTDRQVDLVAPLNGALENAFRNILRTDAYSPSNLGLAESLAPSSGPNAIAALVQRADLTTSVATLTYQFFTGHIPSEAGLDYLVSPTGPNPNDLNSPYFQSFSLENRYINFAISLAKGGEARASFEAAYGPKTLLETVKSAYLTIFGSTPTDAKAHALLDSRADYFAYYGQDGANGVGTKAAVVGWLLAEAAKADVGVMQTANIAFLTDLADGANFSVNLVGTYGGAPYFG